ncbi:MAG: transglycosylase SLT domain-containing protein [Alphaproteobacteria bacterium]|nr:transglycosylase SLT domain-containing protein [Alphaproteobacteria bacterium]
MGFSATAASADIVHKYQGVASNNVIQAVATASKKTGVDFSFLMEKASTESGFNPKATSSTSSATGLYQFISTTWLGMIKKYGQKYGLGQYADQITIKNGKACVEDCEARDKILALRKDPAISALMAGEYSAQNRQYLKSHVRGEIGSTELYLAHFMGAGGATKFLNSRAVDPQAVGAEIFPHEARANRHVFYTHGGKPRTLQQIYDFFDNKFTDDSETGATPSPTQTTTLADAGSVTAPGAGRAALHHGTHATHAARALPVFDDRNQTDDIIWSDDPRFQHAGSLFRQNGTGMQNLSPGSILALSAMADASHALFPHNHHYDSYGYNS